jgi:hypothetical protein
VSKAKVFVIVLSAMMAALIVHGLVGDVGRADAYFLPETDVPVPVTDPYGGGEPAEMLL